MATSDAQHCLASFVAGRWGLPHFLLHQREANRSLTGSPRIKQVGSRYAVPSQSGASSAYIVDLVDETCTCADYELRRAQCKHLAIRTGSAINMSRLKFMKTLRELFAKAGYGDGDAMSWRVTGFGKNKRSVYSPGPSLLAAIE